MTDAKFITTAARMSYRVLDSHLGASHIRIDIARKIQASGQYWRDQAVSARGAGDYAREKYRLMREAYLRSRREVLGQRAEFAKQVERADGWMASGRKWRERAHKAITQRDGARWALAKLVERTDGWTIRAERMEDAIRAYHATLTEGGYVDTVARTEALKKLMEVVE